MSRTGADIQRDILAKIAEKREKDVMGAVLALSLQEYNESRLGEAAVVAGAAVTPPRPTPVLRLSSGLSPDKAVAEQARIQQKIREEQEARELAIALQVSKALHDEAAASVASASSVAIAPGGPSAAASGR